MLWPRFLGVEGGGAGRAGLSARQLGMRTCRRTALIMDNNACDTRPEMYLMNEVWLYESADTDRSE